MKKGIVIASVLILMLALSSMAQAPDSFVYQGRLTDASGNPITTTTAVTFRLYTAITGGSLIHSWNSVSVSPDANGVFTAELINMDRNDFVNGNKLYMQLEIGGETLSPRQLLTSVPYAYSAEYAQNLPNNSVTSANIVNNSITSADILNEAGFSRSNSSPVSVANTGITFADSVEISIPASGYVIVFGIGRGMISASASALIGNVTYAITDSRVSSLPEYLTFGSNGENVGTGGLNCFYPVSAENTFYKASAGTYKFYMAMSRGITDGSASYSYGRLTAIYVPTSYGTISKSYSENPGPDFTDVNEVTTVDETSPQSETQTQYIVDLRELELKATKAQLEAEKAQRELLEAKQQLQEK